jgi:hypothetical protein
MNKLLRDFKSFLIIILLVIVVVLIIFDPNITGFSIGFNEKKSFEIEDKCGQFMNLLSHTINDESSCKSRCRAQCETKDYKYDSIEFKSNNISCNFCKCYCRR